MSEIWVWTWSERETGDEQVGDLLDAKADMAATSAKHALTGEPYLAGTMADLLDGMKRGLARGPGSGARSSWKRDPMGTENM